MNRYKRHKCDSYFYNKCGDSECACDFFLWFIMYSLHGVCSFFSLFQPITRFDWWLLLWSTSLTPCVCVCTQLVCARPKVFIDFRFECTILFIILKDIAPRTVAVRRVTYPLYTHRAFSLTLHLPLHLKFDSNVQISVLNNRQSMF